MKTITIKWSTDDVLGIAENMDIELTEQEADKILENLERLINSLKFGWLTILKSIATELDVLRCEDWLKKI